VPAGRAGGATLENPISRFGPTHDEAVQREWLSRFMYRPAGLGLRTGARGLVHAL
jgi:hypothetical protein